MPLSYRTIDQPVYAETTEKKSRFLCALVPIVAETEVLPYIESIRNDHPEASHHCLAYRLRGGAERASDDGEPSGTAGRPMLHVLQRQNLTDLLTVVTRYFGGTLLGAGGLARAYSHAVAQAITRATVVVYAPYDRYDFPLPYAEYERAQKLLCQPGWEMEPAFAERVQLTLYAPVAARSQASSLIAALTRSQAASLPSAQVLRPTPPTTGHRTSP